MYVSVQGGGLDYPHIRCCLYYVMTKSPHSYWEDNGAYDDNMCPLTFFIVIDSSINRLSCGNFFSYKIDSFEFSLGLSLFYILGFILSSSIFTWATFRRIEHVICDLPPKYKLMDLSYIIKIYELKIYVHTLLIFYIII